MKTYQYDPKRYLFSIIFTNILMIILLIYSLIGQMKNIEFNLYTLIIIITGYHLFNSFVALNQPRIIKIDEDNIEFHSFGRYHYYKIKELNYVRIKEFYGKNIYLRIGNPNLTSGRYWINTSMYTNGIELYQLFTRLEKQIHPDLLKFRTRPPSLSKKKKKRK